jgi:hypothetical protein
MQRPLEFLLAVVADESQPIGTRITAATAALPFTNHRLGLIDSAGRDQPLHITVLRFADLPDEPDPKLIEHDQRPH